MNIIKSLESYFRVAPADHPFTPKVRQVATVTTPEVKPINPAYDRGGMTYERTEFEDGFEDEIWNVKKGQKTKEMTSFDIDILKERGLKEAKYRELKVYWCADYSAAKIAKTINKYGYGERTIETYLSAMNAAYNHSSITPLP